MGAEYSWLLSKNQLEVWDEVAQDRKALHLGVHSWIFGTYAKHFKILRADVLDSCGKVVTVVSKSFGLCLYKFPSKFVVCMDTE